MTPARLTLAGVDVDRSPGSMPIFDEQRMAWYMHLPGLGYIILKGNPVEKPRWPGEVEFVMAEFTEAEASDVRDAR